MASRPTEVHAAGALIGGKYRLKHRIGQGAMGAVWVAENITLQAEVAIKFFTPTESNAHAADRLLTEARAAAQLMHPGIVRVFDFGKLPAGEPFIVMEVLAGENFADFLRREGRVSPQRAARILLPIADALAAAHEKGIVHRDLKPANLFLSKSESGRIQPKVVDFGLARRSEGDGTQTVEGTLLGSPHYMSPEQVQGLVAEAQSDVWAFCVVLFQAVMGATPFAGPNEFALMRAIVDEPPQEIYSDVGDDEFRSIVIRGLRKEPSERWASMRELGRALAFWLIGQGVKDDVASNALLSTWVPTSGDRLKSVRPSRPKPDVPPASADDDGELTWDAPAASTGVPRPPAAPVPRAPPVPPAARLSPASPRRAADDMQVGEADAPVPVLRPSQAPTRATIAGALPPELAQLHALTRSDAPLKLPAPSVSVVPPPPLIPASTPPPMQPPAVDTDFEMVSDDEISIDEASKSVQGSPSSQEPLDHAGRATPTKLRPSFADPGRRTIGIAIAAGGLLVTVLGIGIVTLRPTHDEARDRATPAATAGMTNAPAAPQATEAPTPAPVEPPPVTGAALGAAASAGTNPPAPTTAPSAALTTSAAPKLPRVPRPGRRASKEEDLGF